MTYSLLGSILIIAFLFIFGERILVGFSLFVDRVRGGSPAPTPTEEIFVLAPTLDPASEATNSGVLPVTGSGTPGTTVVLYVNGSEYKKTTVEEDGTFAFPAVRIVEGDNVITAKTTGDSDKMSDTSNELRITLKREGPILEVSSPEPDITVYGPDNGVNATGQTEEEVSVTINGRLVLVRPDGTFSTRMTLSDGDNTLTFVATDVAGNQTTVERHVTYQR
jgi:hypothetical protein